MQTHLPSWLAHGIPLHCLRLTIPPAPPPLEYVAIAAPNTRMPDDWNPLSTWRTEALQARAREKGRVRALSAIAQPLADAIPTLRVLSIADMGICTEIMAATEEACDELERASDAAEFGLGEEGDGAEGTVYEWDELRRLSHIRVRRWWRVEDDEAGRRRLVEISEAEGERAQTVIESPDWNAETGLSGTSHYPGTGSKLRC